MSLSATCLQCSAAGRQQCRPAIRARSRPMRLALRATQADARAEAAAPAAAEALRVLQAAVATSQVPPVDVLKAMLALEKAKPQETDDWPAILGGTRSPGHRWRLVFTTGTKEVQAAMKGVEGSSHGKYFPITAVQRWDASQSEIENGIFFGFLAALTFKGPYAFQGRKLYFDFDRLCLKLGPKTFEIPLKSKIDPSTFKPAKDLPFFIFSYVSENMVVARGRSGGLAVWARTTPSWELKNGIL